MNWTHLIMQLFKDCSQNLIILTRQKFSWFVILKLSLVLIFIMDFFRGYSNSKYDQLCHKLTLWTMNMYTNPFNLLSFNFPVLFVILPYLQTHMYTIHIPRILIKLYKIVRIVNYVFQFKSWMQWMHCVLSIFFQCWTYANLQLWLNNNLNIWMICHWLTTIFQKCLSFKVEYFDAQKLWNCSCHSEGPISILQFLIKPTKIQTIIFLYQTKCIFNVFIKQCI